MMRNQALDSLASRAGIVFDEAIDFLPRVKLPAGKGHNGGPAMDEDISTWGGVDQRKLEMAFDAFMARDAANTNTYNQPTLVTAPNSAIPSFLTTWIDPKLIEVLLAPMRAEMIYGVTKKGDWITQTAMFAIIEMIGEAASYGDFNQNGVSDANVNWPQRQSYNFQTWTQWGTIELERMGAARIDWASKKNLSSANTLNRLMNLIYFFGVSGLENYGGLNDPSLPAALTPAIKVATGTSWANALPTEILADVQAMYAALQKAATGTNNNLDMMMPMTLALSGVSETYLANTNSFGLTAKEMIGKVFPRLKVVTAPEYISGTTYSCQLIIDELDGQRAAECGFNEKMRAHRIETYSSHMRQKKSAGSWGTIVYRPIQFSSMSGI